MAEEDIDIRLAAEVTHLSTKLVTEVAKLLQLEETILQLRKENAAHKQRLTILTGLESEVSTIREEHAALTSQVAKLTKEKLAAEAKNKQLEGEIEDLTASLFNEANEMVSNASRETYNFKLKNRKLIEELSEKDAIIENLQAQLKDLKLMFMKLEDQQRTSSANTPRMDHQFESQDNGAAGEPDDELLLLLLLVYGPRVRALRFDLPAYQQEFKSFVYQLIKPDFQFDLASLKTLKYFRHIWLEEIEPCVAHIPTPSGNFMNLWSKGKTFWGLLVEGRAIIEPVSGVNETFKLTYKGAKTGNEIPVAIEDPCVFCGECKDDMLEHARLYNLKLYGPASETGGYGHTREIAGEAHEVISTHPLCNFCLVKLRAICDLFAKLRMIHANIYKLKQNSTYDDMAFVSNFQFKKVDAPTPKLNPSDEPAMLKLYMMLLVIRAKIFWSKIGIWDTEEDVQTLSLDEFNIDVFRQVVRDNVAFQHFKPQQVLEDHKVAMTTSADYDREIGVSKNDSIANAEKETAVNQKEGDDTIRSEVKGEADSDEVKGEVNSKEVQEKSDADTSELLEEEQHDNIKPNSKSKKLKAQINNDLKLTMEMLKENIDEKETGSQRDN